MLVLARRLEESIIINGNIEVKVVDIQQGKVRLGITAPDDIRVDRKEIHDLRQENDGEAEE